MHPTYMVHAKLYFFCEKYTDLVIFITSYRYIFYINKSECVCVCMFAKNNRFFGWQRFNVANWSSPASYTHTHISDLPSHFYLLAGG